MLVTIIKVTMDMSEWVEEVMAGWINYLVTRTQFMAGVSIPNVLADPEFLETDDMCQAMVLLDYKMVLEVKGVLNNLLMNIQTLEEVVGASMDAVLENPID